MEAQLALWAPELGWLQPVRRPESRPEATLEERWRAFHEANPYVLDAIRALAWQLKDAGRTRGSMALIFERLRWEYAIRARDPARTDEFALNNSYRAFYARLLNQEPGLEGFFEVREQRAKGVS